jgi:hypothetical protein
MSTPGQIMDDKKLRALFDLAKHPNTPEQEGRTSAMKVVQELARRREDVTSTSWTDADRAFAAERLADLQHKLRTLRTKLRERTRQLRYAKDEFQDLLGSAIDTDSYIEAFRTRTREIRMRLVPKPMDPMQRVKKALRDLAADRIRGPSDRLIARITELSPTTVGKLRRELGPTPAARVGYDGVTRRVPGKGPPNGGRK